MAHPSYNYRFSNEAQWQIESSYLHVALKYRHTFTYEDLNRNVKQAISNALHIEQSLLRRKPTIERWQQEGWHMAHEGKWYYAYTIKEDTITIEDACHEQNMQ